MFYLRCKINQSILTTLAKDHHPVILGSKAFSSSLLIFCLYPCSAFAKFIIFWLKPFFMVPIHIQNQKLKLLSKLWIDPDSKFSWRTAWADMKHIVLFPWPNRWSFKISTIIYGRKSPKYCSNSKIIIPINICSTYLSLIY